MKHTAFTGTCQIGGILHRPEFFGMLHDSIYAHDGDGHRGVFTKGESDPLFTCTTCAQTYPKMPKAAVEAIASVVIGASPLVSNRKAPQVGPMQELRIPLEHEGRHVGSAVVSFDDVDYSDDGKCDGNIGREFDSSELPPTPDALGARLLNVCHNLVKAGFRVTSSTRGGQDARNVYEELGPGCHMASVTFAKGRTVGSGTVLGVRVTLTWYF